MVIRKNAFTPLEKATDKVGSRNIDADSGLMPPSAHTVRENSLTGFTLIELVVVVAIVAIISIAGLVSFSILIPGRLEAEVRKAVSDLYWAREMAVAGHHNYIVVFEPVNERYIIYRDSITPANEIKRQNLEVDLVSVTPAPTQLQFNFPSGTTQSKQINLSYKGKPGQIIVFGQTGYVKIQ